MREPTCLGEHGGAGWIALSTWLQGVGPVADQAQCCRDRGVDAQNRRPEAGCPEAGGFKRGELMRRKSPFGTHGAPYLLGVFGELERAAGARAEQDSMRRGGKRAEELVASPRSVDRRQVGPLGLRCGFGGDAIQALDLGPASSWIPARDRALGHEERDLVDAELGGHPNAHIELRSLGQAKNEDQSRSSGRQLSSALRDTDDGVPNRVETGLCDSPFPIEELDAIASAKAKDTDVTARGLAEDDGSTAQWKVCDVKAAERHGGPSVRTQAHHSPSSTSSSRCMAE